MTTFVDFQPSTGSPFQFSATLDGAQYSVLVTWNLNQRWYVNVYNLSGGLVAAVPVVPTGDPRPLAPIDMTETIFSMTWSPVNGGQVAVVTLEPSVYTLGAVITISGATNSGTAGDAAVNGAFVINTFTDAQHFTFLLTAPPGAIGAIGGGPVIVGPTTLQGSLDTYAFDVLPYDGRRTQVGTIGGHPVIVVPSYGLTWSNASGQGLVTATTAAPHGYRVGAPVDLVIANETPSGYNGVYRCDVVSKDEFTYPLAADPGQEVVVGTYCYEVNLVGAYFRNSRLVYRESQARFEVSP